MNSCISATHSNVTALTFRSLRLVGYVAQLEETGNAVRIIFCGTIKGVMSRGGNSDLGFEDDPF
jgi:hypothetical protein